MASGLWFFDREAAIRRLCLIVLAAVLCLTGAAQAQQVSVVGALPFGASYVADGWLPVRVDVKNDGDREIVGTVRIVPTGQGVPEMRTPVSVPAKSRVVKTIWGYFPWSKSNLIGRVTVNDSSGAQLARVEMTGAPSDMERQFLPNGVYEHGFLIGISGDEDDASEYETLDYVGETLKNVYEVRTNLVQIDPSTAPNSWVPYRSAYAVQIRHMDPDVLAPETRKALMDYVRAGGVLLISAPDANQIGGSWLEPLLPVRLIGNRELNQAPPYEGGEAMKFAEYMGCAEALDGDGEVLLRDGQFVHAAYRRFGLGRIAFSSFPAGALAVDDVRAGHLWHELLGFNRHPVGVGGSMAQEEFAQLMEPMLGRKAASWAIAAGAVGGLVLVVLLAHVVWRGPSRPSAFKISLAASVLIAAAFSLLAAMRQETEPLQQAKLTLIDASPEGSLVSEFGAVSGSQQLLDRSVKESRSSLRAALVRQDRPVLSEWPATLERIELNPQRVDLVSLASKMDTSATAGARGRFGPKGLELTLQNNMGTELTSAQLGWGPYRLSMPAISTGESRAIVDGGDVRPMDEYTSASGLASQDEQHKGAILKSLLRSQTFTRSREEWPTVFGWAGQWAGITNLSGEEPNRTGSQTLVRIPLQLDRSEGPVQIDGVFNGLYLGEARGLPYDAARREFIRTSLPGDWIIAVEYPREVGQLRPTKARLRIDLATSQHRVQIRGGQCTGGGQPSGRGNPNGKLIADWDNSVGMQSVEFECTPEDFDQQGRVWLRVSVQSSGAAGSMGVEPQWRFGQLLVDLEGDVTKSSTQP